MTKTCVLCGREFEGWGNNPDPYTQHGECCDRCEGDVIDYRLAKLTGDEYPPLIEVTLKTGVIRYVYATRYNNRKIEKSHKVLAWDYLHDLPQNTFISFVNDL